MTSSRYLRPGKFEIIAHRGGGLEAPENTLAAFSRANKVFADCIFELDVHLTRDNQVVVIHDDRIERTTNGTGFVKDYSLSEIQQYDAGFHFTQDSGKTFPFRNKGVRIPLLSDVFKLFPKNRVSIEIKTSHPLFGKYILDIVDQAQARARVVLAGANHHDLITASKLAPDICSGYSAKEVFWTLIWSRLHLDFLNPSRGHVYQVPLNRGKRQIVTPTFIKKAHKRDKAVHVWTINDEATMRHLVEWGADGIVTDAPSLLVQVAQAFKRI